MDESQALALLAGAYAARRRSGASIYVYIFWLKQAMQNIANRATVPAHSDLHGRPGGDRCCRAANETCALIAMLTSISLMLYIYLGTKIAFPWYAVIGSLTTLIVAFVASLFLADSSAKTPQS